MLFLLLIGRIISGYEVSFFDKYNKQRKIKKPRVVFVVDFKKVGIKKILIIFIPIFAAVFFALFAFLMSFNNYIGKFTLSVSSITALLGYRFVIQKMMPKIGYLTVTDKLYLFFLFFSIAIFIFQLLLTRQYMLLLEKDRVARKERAEADVVMFQPKETEQINTYAYFIAIVIFVVTVTYIVLK